MSAGSRTRSRPGKAPAARHRPTRLLADPTPGGLRIRGASGFGMRIQSERPHEQARAVARPSLVRRLLGLGLVATACDWRLGAAGDVAVRVAFTEPSASLRRSAQGVRRRVDRHGVPDRTRRLPDQGEPHLRQPVRDVPGRERRDGRLRPRRAATAHTRDRRRHRLRGHPALLHVLTRRLEPREDGRVQPGRGVGPMGLHAASPSAASELLALGSRVRARGQLLLLGAGTLVPEPPVLDRRPVRRRSRQPQAHRAVPIEQHVRL